MSDHLYRRVGLCLPPALHSELVAAAARAGLPVSTYARLVLANQLGQIPAKVAA